MSKQETIREFRNLLRKHGTILVGDIGLKSAYAKYLRENGLQPLKPMKKQRAMFKEVHRLLNPTQSQLQNMIIEYWWGNDRPGNWLSVLLQKFNWWLNDTLPESTSMEQLWIEFYMHEHNKIWVGDKWVKEEN